VNRSLVAVIASVALLGCAKKAELYEDRDWTQEGGGSTQAAWREVEALFSAEESDADRYNYVLRGVRHDLTIAKDATFNARCTCLDVVVGPSDDPRFRWAGEVPIISTEQIAVAVRTEGSQCSLPSGALRRPSIYAVDEANGNTVVVIEDLPIDRPQALGAIVQMPEVRDALYVRSRRYKDRVLPYAQGTKATSGMCRVMRRDPAKPKVN
jgi:hypothetical protein